MNNSPNCTHILFGYGSDWHHHCKFYPMCFKILLSLWILFRVKCWPITMFSILSNQRICFILYKHEKISGTQGIFFLFLQHFDVIWGALLNRRTVTWTLCWRHEWKSGRPRNAVGTGAAASICTAFQVFPTFYQCFYWTIRLWARNFYLKSRVSLKRNYRVIVASL